MQLCCLHSLWLPHTLQGRFVIPLRVTQKTLTDPWWCLLCATSAFFGERLGTAGTGDLGSLGCSGDVWSSLVLFFFPRLFFCCQLHYRVPGAVFRLQPHVNHNFSSYQQFFHFIPCPLLLPPVSDTAAQGPRQRQGTAGEMCGYLSQLKLHIFPIWPWVTIPPDKPAGMEPWVVISAINSSVLWCLPLLYPVTGFSSEQ